MMNCPNCGISHSLESERCIQCNFKLPEKYIPLETTAPETKDCWNCKHPNMLTAVSCGHCNIKFVEQRRVQQPLNSKWRTTNHTIPMAV